MADSCQSVAEEVEISELAQLVLVFWTLQLYVMVRRVLKLWLIMSILRKFLSFHLFLNLEFGIVILVMVMHVFLQEFLATA